MRKNQKNQTPQSSRNTSLENLMKPKLITIGPSEPLENALSLFAMHRIRHLPVVNEEGFVIGVLSDRDILRASVPLTDQNGAPMPDLRFIAGSCAVDYMSTMLKWLP